MNKVTLYQVTKSEHSTYSGYIQASQMTYDDVIRIGGSSEFISKREVKNINIPIQKYVFCQKHWNTGEVSENIVYAAFDDDLLKLIQCERNKFDEMNNNLICKVAEISDLKADKMCIEDQCLKLKTELSKVKQMSFWKRLVFLFKGSVE